jgi:hypothetical protein
MLVLGQKKEPRKIVLREQVGTPGKKGFEPEAFVVMAPINGPMRRRAARSARRLMGLESAEAGELELDQLLDLGEIGSKELIRLGAVEWGGLGDAAGKPLALTPDRETRFATANQDDRPTGSIDLLLADDDLVERIADDYVRPDAMKRAEKNASSALPNGTGKAGTRANDIASSVAGPKTKARAARNAPTSRKRSARKPAKLPGTR